MSRGWRPTCVVGDVGLGEVAAGNQGWLGLAEVLDELGLGNGGQHGAWALEHAGVCEQLCRGAPVGLPHLVAQLRIEACIAAEEGCRRGGGRRQGPYRGRGASLPAPGWAPRLSTGWGAAAAASEAGTGLALGGELPAPPPSGCQPLPQPSNNEGRNCPAATFLRTATGPEAGTAGKPWRGLAWTSATLDTSSPLRGPGLKQLVGSRGQAERRLAA